MLFVLFFSVRGSDLPFFVSLSLQLFCVFFPNALKCIMVQCEIFQGREVLDRVLYMHFNDIFNGVMVWLSCSSRRAHGYSDAKSTMSADLCNLYFLDPYLCGDFHRFTALVICFVSCLKQKHCSCPQISYRDKGHIVHHYCFINFHLLCS